MKKKILFVDDEQETLDGLKRMLHEKVEVWDMSFAKSALEAESILSIKGCDVAVLDFNMPFMNGFELLEKMKGNPKMQNTQVIVLTGVRDYRLKREALNLGANDLLEKPVQKEDLVARISSVLRIKDYQDELADKNEILEQQLIRSQKQEVVGVLASGAIHDLNNILQLIIGYSDLISQEIGDTDAVLIDLGKIPYAAKRAQKIMEQILKFSRTSEASSQLTDLSFEVEQTLNLFKPMFPMGVEVKYEHPEHKLFINIDPTELGQVLMNLFINAGQAMPEGGELSVSVSECDTNSITISGKKELLNGTYIKLSVEDTGVGMDEATRESIFDPFFTTKQLQNGSGLGLSVVLRIIVNNGGTISVDSTPGKGTLFSIYFPNAFDGTTHRSKVKK